MKRLGAEGFERARRFLKTEARALDRALFEHRFEGADADCVARELARYQNVDGGFGHALEPDARTPASSALATGIGLEILRELGRAGEDAMVAGAVAFLLRSFDTEAHVWRVVPAEANDDPHAPWWHDEDGSLRETFDGYAIIPRAQLVALLHDYGALVPAGWLGDVTERTAAAIETIDEEAFAGGGDSLRYALELAEAETVPDRVRERILPRLREMTDRGVCRDPEAWGTYCATPLKVAPTPASAVAEMIWDDIQRHLDYVIEHQTPEGTWEPTWTWGDFYPEHWEAAKQEWRGELTLRTLTTLRAYGRWL